MTPCALIVGVGDIAGIGGAVALRCAQGGLAVCVVGRTPGKTRHVVEAIAAQGAQAMALVSDLADEAGIGALYAQLEQAGWSPELVVFNAASLNVPRRLMGTSAAVLEDRWRHNALAGILVSQAAARHMLPRGRGTILVTGATASMRGKPLFAAFASAKAALRAFTASLAWELAPQGIHVAHIVIDGMVAGRRVVSAGFGLGRLALLWRGPSRCLQPQDVAETYWQLHRQAAGGWSHEIDLRPFCEPF